MRITGAESTLLFGGTRTRPLQIMRVTLADAHDDVTVRVEGAGVSTPAPAGVRNPARPAPGGTREAEVAVAVAAPHGPGSRLPVTVVAERQAERAESAATLTVAAPGWTIWMVSHFHYDPVWWNTQGQFAQAGTLLPDASGALPDVRTAFELVRLHLDAARADPDYKFVLAEIDYLKPYFDSHPQDRAELRALVEAGRVEIVGGTYNEPNSNLTCAESAIRNIVHGLGHQRDVLGADPQVGWALDVFGHDPAYPGLMAAAGLTASAWARGPYHQWGPWRTVGDNARMQFPSEFEWVSPDGRGLLTSYMPNHYGAGWVIHQAAGLAEAQAAALAQLALLAPAAATPNVLLPVGADHVIPARWATEMGRDLAARYVWPRCVTALPSEFFAAVRDAAAERGVWLTPQTRDMNPVYPGKDVSYIDTKQAQRSAETAVCDGERLATLAWLAGAEYPAQSLDKAWRQLLFGAHHDAITGTESDQVYLDLLGGWREAFERGDAARRDAAGFLAGLVNTISPDGAAPGQGAGAGPNGVAAAQPRPGVADRPVVVFNTLSWPRAGIARIRLAFPEPGPAWLTLRDGAGAPAPFLAEGVRRHPGGGLAEASLAFRADLPALGHSTWWVSASGRGEQHGATFEDAAGWAPVPGAEIANEAFLVAADPGRGGTLRRVLDRRAGVEVLRGPGNELVWQDEYALHPRWGEGPWLLSPKGPGAGSAAAAAAVRAERCPIGSRLVAEFAFGGLRVTQETLLWDGIGRIEFRTHVDGSLGQDRLLRVRFAARAPGCLPVYQCATAVVGRPFGWPGADVAKHPFTLDNPAHEWFGLGSTARVTAGGAAAAIGVAEVILPGRGPAAAWQAAARDLVAALARAGVTATCAWPDGPRYGALDVDSNLPDCRIALGGPDDNPWTARLLAALGPREAAAVSAILAGEPGARVWAPAARPRPEVFAPSADVRGERDLPTLIVAGPGLPDAIAALSRDLAGAEVKAEAAGDAPDPPLAGHSVALLNRGTPGSLISPDGTMHIALMRACSAWPSGVWIDGERRTAPDGSSFAWQHWSHTFSYALAAGAGDWREAGFTLAGQEYNHDPIACETGAHPGPLPARASLCEVSTPPLARPVAMLSALKPRGNPLASGRPGTPRREAGVTVRLRDAGGAPGQAAPARVRLFTGIASARQSDLLEHEDGPPLTVLDGAAVVRVPGAGMSTLAIMPSRAAAAARGGTAAAQGGPATRQPGDGAGAEPAQPVFTRYWLHGKGPAPAGNLPVAVHLSPGRLSLPAAPPAGGRATGPREDRAPLRLTVACGPRRACGRVTLDVPPELAVSGASPARLAYELPQNGFASWDLSVRARPGARRGRYFVAAQIRDGLGQILEDAALVTVGEDPPPAPGQPLGAMLEPLAAQERAQAAEVGLSLLPGSLALAPGGRAELSARIVNRTAGWIRGECQLVSPFGTWEGLGPWTRGFAAAPSETVALPYPVALPPGARPGSRWWALAKVMYFGRVRYSECAELAVEG